MNKTEAIILRYLYLHEKTQSLVEYTKKVDSYTLTKKENEYELRLTTSGGFARTTIIEHLPKNGSVYLRANKKVIIDELSEKQKQVYKDAQKKMDELRKQLKEAREQLTIDFKGAK